MPSERKFGGMRFSIIQVAIVVGVCAPVLGAQGTTPGFFVETRVTTVSKGGSGNATTRTHVTRTWTSATCSRTDGEANRGDSTGYQVMRRTPPTFLDVVPRDRTVYTVNSAGAKAMAADAAKTLGPMPEISGSKVPVDGGVLLGHRTHKFELRTITRSTAGAAEVGRAPTVITYWVADDPADPLVAAYRATRPTMGAFDRVSTSTGMTLRSETHSQWLRDVTEMTTREVIAWRREEVPLSRCGIPNGYRTVDLVADLRAKQSALAELRRLSHSSNPADRARGRVLGDSLFKDLRRTLPAHGSLRDDPRAVLIDGAGKKKP